MFEKDHIAKKVAHYDVCGLAQPMKEVMFLEVKDIHGQWKRIASPRCLLCQLQCLIGDFCNEHCVKRFEKEKENMLEPLRTPPKKLRRTTNEDLYRHMVVDYRPLESID